MITEKLHHNKKGEVISIEHISDEKQSLYWRFVNWLLGCPCCGKGGHILRILLVICILIGIHFMITDIPFLTKIIFAFFGVVSLFLISKVKM